MLFNSLVFVFGFLPVVFALHWLLPARFRWALLLLASYVFYMWWEPAYALLILFSTTVDYFVARAMPGAEEGRKRGLLAISLLTNFGLLFSFKYYNLINGAFTAAAASFGVDWPLGESSLLLPVGISFYTFQTVGYSIDVYRGQLEPERHFGRFALYVSYFPQLVAGPIERAGRLLPQLRQSAALDRDRVVSGLRQAGWGLFKKVVVADWLARVVAPVYDDPQAFGGFAFLLATLGFTWQLYCDFSGYTDIAIGVARMFGVDLMKNFDQPHGSRSIREFWTRWHISLSTWFRDYVYLPLGGNRVSQARWIVNIGVVFALSGLWHGAQWSMLVWGLLHGFYLVFGRLTAPAREAVAQATGFASMPRLRTAWQVGSVFALWSFSLIFFRANDIGDAWYIVTHLTDGFRFFGRPAALAILLDRIGMDFLLLLGVLSLVPVVEAVDHFRRRADWVGWWEQTPWARTAGDYATLFGVLALGNFSDVPFVYFQF